MSTGYSTDVRGPLDRLAKMQDPSASATLVRGGTGEHLVCSRGEGGGVITKRYSSGHFIKDLITPPLADTRN